MNPPSRYSFVNARPQSKAERRKTRTAIRSHIGKWTQEKQQKLETQPTSTSAKVSPTESLKTVPQSPTSAQQTQSQPHLKTEDSRSSDDLDSTVDHSRGSLEDEDDTHSSLAVVISPGGRLYPHHSSSINSSSSIQWMGAGVLDPFRTFNSRFSLELVNQCHQYSLKVLWPGLTPKHDVAPEPAASKEWFPMLLADQVALHSLLFGALSHQRLNMLKGATAQANLDFTSMERDMRDCEMESVALISKAIREDNAITDGMIVSVLCMAANSWDSTLAGFLANPGPLPFFDPLLRSLQWLDVYGLLSVHPAHAQGLLQLIKIRGGLHTIKTGGLAATVFYSGIINATKYLMQPPFPFIPLVEGGDSVADLWSLVGTSPKELRQEYVFHGLFELGLTLDLALIMVAMQRYGDNVQGFVDAALPELNLARLCDNRNLIQCTLLSIPAENDLPDCNPQPLYEPTRLALMIYSLGVIFPLPPQTAPTIALVGMLRAALKKTDVRSNWASSHEAQRLLVWILFIGAIASRDAPEDHTWFLGLLRKLTAKEGRGTTFEELKKDVLSRILWLDRSCDNAGRLLWAEVLGMGD